MKYDKSLFEDINNAENEQANFYAYGLTPLQAIGIDAVYNKLQSNNHQLNGFVIIGSHPITGKLLDKETFSLKNENIRFIFSDLNVTNNPIRDRLIAIKLSASKTKKNKVFVICSEIDYHWFSILEKRLKTSNICYILIDDGSGSYTNLFKKTLNLTLNAKHINKFNLSYIKTYIKILIRVSYIYLLMYILTKKGRLIDYRIFKYSHNQFNRNNDISNFYSEAFKAKGIKKINKEWEIFNESALINTQCLMENGIINNSIDIDIYEKVVSILNDLNYHTVVKTHPREQVIARYNSLDNTYIYSDSSVSQEVILSCCEKKPKCIISIFSSTLLNANGLFNIPAISLAKIALKYDISNIFKKQLEEYINKYKSIFYFPNNYEELKELLKKLA